MSAEPEAMVADLFKIDAEKSQTEYQQSLEDEFNKSCDVWGDRDQAIDAKINLSKLTISDEELCDGPEEPTIARG